MRQHETVVQLRAPADQFAFVRRFPEACHHRAQQQHLRQTHLWMRRHFKTAKLYQTEPSSGAVGRIELVDTEFRAMGVAGEIDQQIAQQTIHQPRRQRFFAGLLFKRHLLECDIQFVEIIVARLVDARRLTGRPDKLA